MEINGKMVGEAMLVRYPQLNFKKGETQKFLTQEDEKQFLFYIMETDLFDFESLKLSSDFCIKHYKDSNYRGEIVDRMRHGLGICVYTTGRLYEGGW